MKQAITNARIAFPDLYEAKAFEGGNPRFGATLILDPEKSEKLIAEIKANMAVVAKEKWGAKADGIMKTLASTGKLCLRDGNDKSEYDGFKNMMYITAGRNAKDGPPKVIDRNRADLTADSGKPYGGCVVNASVEIWAQDNNFGKRINAQLRGVQFVADGDAFSGSAPATADEFEELEAVDGDVNELF
jgi:hypothetical protein